MKTLICNCNRTMPLESAPIARALAQTPGASADGLETTHTLLCRREATAFQRAAKATGAGDELLVACTQEERLFVELNQHTEGAASRDERPIRFVNIRETGGWSRDAAAAMPKIAALLAAAQAPQPEPVGSVGYRSDGRCLVIGRADAAERAASMLAGKLDPTLLITDAGGALPQAHEHDVQTGRLASLSGWLGAFEAEWDSGNPIDLNLCTKCNACIAVCPEGAIGLNYRIDLDRCRSHRACVAACDAAGAIDFAREPERTRASFDLVLDLRDAPAFTRHALPQGYHHVPGGRDDVALTRAVLALADSTGEFDKPKFFRWQPELCAHSRNERIGCRACIDVCSAEAITSDASRKGKTSGRPRNTGPASAAVLPPALGGGVIVEPHLCVGCGACTTVCPTGALGYAYPGTADLGKRIGLLLKAYANAGGRSAALLLHSEGAGAKAIDVLGRAAQLGSKGRPVAAMGSASSAPAASLASAAAPAGSIHGVPARVLPLALWHAASTGIEIWLAAIAQGASQVWVLLTDDDAPQYREALAAQMAVAQAVLAGLGYAGEHFALIDAGSDTDLAQLDAALRRAPAQGVARPASFAIGNAKRSTLELALDRLLAQAPAAAEEIALPAASPLGSLAIDTERCTMCLACVGACPSRALADNAERPQLRFIEKNCVQCGLCAKTCPEDAITLLPRLWTADAGRARRELRVLHEVPPFACVRCGKPFGTVRAIDAMVAKLAGHSAFQGRAAERLKMCGDCRVIDLHSAADEVRITDLMPRR